MARNARLGSEEDIESPPSGRISLVPSFLPHVSTVRQAKPWNSLSSSEFERPFLWLLKAYGKIHR